MNHEALRKEFDRQIKTLMAKGYPTAAGISPTAFLKHVAPLKMRLEQLTLPDVDLDLGRLPFVVVVKSELVTVEKAMPLVERDGRQGLTKLYPLEPKDFQPIDGLGLPSGILYLMTDIDRGKDSLNVTPAEALMSIERRKRSPLTIDEGIAIITHFPVFLKKNNFFSLLASRRSDDKRVPAIWINQNKQPNLGWCWEGNPHTWLGSASCRSRIGS